MCHLVFTLFHPAALCSHALLNRSKRTYIYIQKHRHRLPISSQWLWFESRFLFCRWEHSPLQTLKPLRSSQYLLHFFFFFYIFSDSRIFWGVESWIISAAFSPFIKLWTCKYVFVFQRFKCSFQSPQSKVLRVFSRTTCLVWKSIYLDCIRAFSHQVPLWGNKVSSQWGDLNVQ